MVASFLQGLLGSGNPDDSRIVPIGREPIDDAVADHDAKHARRRLQARGRGGHEISQWPLGCPGRADHLDACSDFLRATGSVQNMNVRGAAILPAFAIEYAAGVERVVVGRKEVDREWNAGQDLARLEHRSLIDLIGFEDVAGHDDELAILLHGDSSQIANSLEARLRPAGLRIRIQELAGNTELPVARVHEAGLHSLPRDLLASSLGGNAQRGCSPQQ